MTYTIRVENLSDNQFKSDEINITVEQGTAARIGVLRPSFQTFYLDASGNGAWDSGDTTYMFGRSEDMPVTGDWTVPELPG